MMINVVAMWRRLEGPTWLVVAAVHVGWMALTSASSALPAWVLVVLGAVLVAWHSSIQHELIHGHPTSKKWLNNLLGSLPMGLIFPYGIFRHSHLAHHRSETLAEPGTDPESYFISASDWACMSSLCRAIHWANGTLVGRVVLGPLISLKRMMVAEAARLAHGDLSHVKHWLSHGAGVALVLIWLVSNQVSLWWYLIGPVWMGNGLVLIRSFAEHQPSDDRGRRTAIVESGWFWSLLFLNNNLHVVHHDDPRLPWYSYKARYQVDKQKILHDNGSNFYRGYGEIFRRFAVRPRRSPKYA